MIISSVLVVAVLSVAVFPGASAECNVCQGNGAACVNSTSFHLCYGNNVPNYEFVYHCKDGFDCTDRNAICVQSNAGRPASCGDTSLCGLCSAHRNHLFACTSRATFRMCYGAAQPKSELGYCPDGYVCDASSDNVCVPAASAADVTCDVTDPVVGSTTPASNDPVNDPTPSVPSTSDSPVTAQEVCDVEQNVGVYQIPGDTSCLEYVRCYLQRGVIYGSLSPCPTGTYFNGVTLQCAFVKPSYCV